MSNVDWPKWKRPASRPCRAPHHSSALGKLRAPARATLLLQHLLGQELRAKGSGYPWLNDTNAVNPGAISKEVKRNCRTTKAQWHGKTEEYSTEERKKSRKERDGDEAKHLPLTRPKTLLRGLRACPMACCMPLTGWTTCTCVCLGQSSKPAAA